MTYDEAKEKALRVLELRPHTEYEITVKLQAAGADSPEISQVIQFLREYRLVDDEAYAQQYAHYLAETKKFGRFRIIGEMKKRGVPNEYIDSSLEFLDESAADALLPLVKKRLGDKELDFKEKNKLMRYFIYRGYEIGDIKECIERIENEL